MSEWEDDLRTFVKTEGQNAIVEALKSYFESKSQAKILAVNFHIQDVTALTAFIVSLNKSPREVLKRCHEILNECREKGFFDAHFPGESFPEFRFRLSAVPNNKNYCIVHVPKQDEIGRFIQFRGTVIKVNAPRVLSAAKNFLCGACKKSTLVHCDPEQYNICSQPHSCQHCSKSGLMRSAISDDPDESVYMPKDYQEIKVQEKISQIGTGTMPRSIWVCLDDDLVDQCKPGDDILIIGTVIRRWQPLGRGPGGETEILLAILANYVKVLNDEMVVYQVNDEQRSKFEQFWKDNEFDELKARNEIIASFCPQVYGLYILKLAVSVILCGGLERHDQTGTTVRGEPHMLMVGDPGTGKSQILRYTAKLTPRSVMTSGIGSTSAGLTVSAIRDGGQWSLEAGALVLADGGICCIDEFGSIKEADRVAIHEAMEQQSVSVAKAGVVTKLQTRCSILATSNPKGKYDPEKPVSVQIGIASPLLSRFDLVYVLLDSNNPEWDEVVSSYILTGQEPWKANSREVWNFDQMKAYFAFCRQNNPKMTPEASKILSKYYQKCRSADGANMARTTVRLLQSTIRLSQGHARLMNHSEVTICDAINAIILLEVSYDSNAAFLNNTNPMHTTFPRNAMKQYVEQAEYILDKLELTKLFELELSRLSQLQAKSRSQKKTQISSKSQEKSIKRPRSEVQECSQEQVTNTKRLRNEEDCRSQMSTKDKLNKFRVDRDNSQSD